jgi:hypothetical protein
MRRARATWKVARAAMNDAIDRWETKAPPWDALWVDPAEAWCDTCTHSERHARSGLARARQWICDDGLPGHARARNVCDACATRSTDVANSDGRVWPMRRVDLTRPHVWSADAYGGTINLLPSDPIPKRRFIVPPEAVHMIDAFAPSTVKRWTRRDDIEVVFRGGLLPASLPSVRSWLPLAGAQHVVLCHGEAFRYDTMRLALVCCDVDSAMWGRVLLVDHTVSERTAVWALADESVGNLLRQYRARAVNDADLGLVAWLYRNAVRG